MPPEPIQLRLKPGRDRSPRQGHPWIFSGAVAVARGPAEAPLARVVSAEGEPLGLGFYGPRSQIRVRLVGRDVEEVDRGFFSGRLAEALRLRRTVLPAETTGYRVVNAEGDGLPGWTVDRFGDVLVSQITSAGLEALRGEAYAALTEAFPGAAVLQLGDLPARREEGLPTADEWIAGPALEEVGFLESGLRFTAELAGGQKTGFYCDQRENRRRVERLAGERTILDLFAHSGGFGLYGRRGGAKRVTAVESSPRLVERGARHFRDNGLEEGVDWVKANAFQFLRETEERFDLVVCDPPPLVRRRADRDAGARAYKDLNRLALGRLEPGGLLLTFSCSGAVDAKLFRQILFAAATEARVRVALLEPLAAAPDHPVSVFHLEGEYLKGWLCQVAGAWL